MRRFLPTLALLLSGCIPSSTNTAGRAPTPRADTFTCLIRELGGAGFAVTSTDRDSGLIRAEKSQSGGFMNSGTTYYLEMTFTVLDAPTPGQSDVRLIMSRSQQNGSGARTSAHMGVVKQDTEQANAILNACGIEAAAA